MAHTPVKVGFDLDGVLLYNPARIVRPFISQLKKKKIGIPRKELEFYVPQKKWEQIMWELFHKSSIFVSPGYKLIAKYKQQGLIDPYLITGRFAHLKLDFEKWKRRMNADELFSQTFINDQDEQPHLFKQRLIKQLNLKVFLEDNWDIVNYLSQELQQQCQIYWITNFFDRQIDYPHKFFKLYQALSELKLEIKTDSL